MSVRHLLELQAAVQGEFTLPAAQILALPDNLHLSKNQEAACDFSAAPRFLGPDYPVVVQGEFTYVYAAPKDNKVRAYFKLEPSPWSSSPAPSPTRGS